ncbi:MAG TPA: type II toxin-antitoxin system RelE/ParE family toxin [Acidimicrobiales bacterium]|nr:type II toxin-antitoxin system RelE/ParE family toxin [Acidimicrobiales bacterium]
MSRYEVHIARRAVKSLARLPRREQQRIRAAIDLLADEPRPPGCVALKGEERAYRVRVGDYRIIYEVHDRRLVVLVVSVGHRRDVYRS